MRPIIHELAYRMAASNLGDAQWKRWAREAGVTWQSLKKATKRVKMQERTIDAWFAARGLVRMPK